MGFDINTATIQNNSTSGGFDLSTATVSKEDNEPLEKQKDKPSFLSGIVRTLMRTSPLEGAKTNAFLLDKLPEVEPGESLQDYTKKIKDVIEPRELDIISQGTIKQLEAPIGAALATAAGPAGPPLASLATGVGKFAALEGVAELSGINQAIQNIPNETVKDSVDVLKFVGLGKLASLKFGKKFSKMRPVQWFLDTFRGPKRARLKLSKESGDIRIKTAKEIKGVRRQKVLKKRILSKEESFKLKNIENESNDLAKALDSANKKYSRSIQDESFLKSKEIRKELPKLYKKKSIEYGEARKTILEGSKVNATPAEVLPAMEESLVNHGLMKPSEKGLVPLREPITIAERMIVAEYGKLKSMNPDAVIDLVQLDSMRQSIKPNFGKPWSPSEHLQAEVSEGISGVIAVKSPEFARFRKAFGPFLEWKKAMNNQFKPFAGKFSNKFGASNIAKYADHRKTIDTDTTALISQLERVSGKDFTSKAKGIRKLGKEIDVRKRSLKDFKNQKRDIIKQDVKAKKEQIDDLIAGKIEEIGAKKDTGIADLQAATDELIAEFGKRRIILGVGAGAIAGGSIVNYVLHKLSFGVLGAIGGPS
jgi:hypothetical protein